MASIVNLHPWEIKNFHYYYYYKEQHSILIKWFFFLCEIKRRRSNNIFFPSKPLAIFAIFFLHSFCFILEDSHNINSFYLIKIMGNLIPENENESQTRRRENSRVSCIRRIRIVSECCAYREQNLANSQITQNLCKSVSSSGKSAVSVELSVCSFSMNDSFGYTKNNGYLNLCVLLQLTVCF